MKNIFAMGLDPFNIELPKTLGGTRSARRAARPVERGNRLSKPEVQHGYSHEIAVVFLGADRQKELLDRYRDVEERLPFEIHPAGKASA